MKIFFYAWKVGYFGLVLSKGCFLKLYTKWRRNQNVQFPFILTVRFVVLLVLYEIRCKNMKWDGNLKGLQAKVSHLFVSGLYLLIAPIKGPKMGTIVEADNTYTKILGRWPVFYYGMGHMLNDITAACWFTYLLLFLTDIGLSPRCIIWILFHSSTS